METTDTKGRIFSRVECLVDLEIVTQGLAAPEIHRVEALDLSLSGLGVTFDPKINRLLASSSVSVRMYGFPPVSAVVCWVGTDRAGLRFTDPLCEIMNSWVGEVLCAQGVKVGNLVPS